MRVCFSVGPLSSKLINSISKSADNVEFSTYLTIADMIKESTMRHIFFDRIVFSEKMLKNPREELQALNNYITEFSDNTKIVFICQGKNVENSEIFTELFNSPLYTVVLVNTVTTSILLEFIKGDITELKAKYYSLDIKEAKALTSKYSGDLHSSETPSEVAKKPEKVGFFKSLFSGKKNSPRKIENENSKEDTVITERKGGEKVSQNNVDLPLGSGVKDVALGGILGANAQLVKNGIDTVGNSIEEVLVSDGTPNLGSQFSYNELEEDNLGIGDLGEQHIDTGFLDDDTESEIEKALKRLEQEEDMSNDFEEKIVPCIEDYSEGLEITPSEELSSVLEETLVPKGNDKELRYRLVIGERGIGATSYIIDYSVREASQGKKVLVVDLDYIKNGVLSYIDTNAFYAQGCFNGVNTLKPYNEDGVDVLSNGYGVGVLSYNIDTLTNSNILENYDIVFIDCPIDCISCLSEDLLSKCITMIKVGGNKGSLLSVLNMLTSRGLISATIEDMLYENSKFEILNKIEFYNEDVNYVKTQCFFGRGDWSSKIV